MWFFATLRYRSDIAFSMQVTATSSLIVDRFREVAVMSYAEFSSIPVDCVPYP